MKSIIKALRKVVADLTWAPAQFLNTYWEEPDAKKVKTPEGEMECWYEVVDGQAIKHAKIQGKKFVEDGDQWTNESGDQLGVAARVKSSSDSFIDRGLKGWIFEGESRGELQLYRKGSEYKILQIMGKDRLLSQAMKKDEVGEYLNYLYKEDPAGQPVADDLMKFL